MSTLKSDFSLSFPATSSEQRWGRGTAPSIYSLSSPLTNYAQSSYAEAQTGALLGQRDAPVASLSLCTSVLTDMADGRPKLGRKERGGANRPDGYIPEYEPVS